MNKTIILLLFLIFSLVILPINSCKPANAATNARLSLLEAKYSHHSPRISQLQENRDNLIVTQDDNNKTLTLRKGENFLLKLGDTLEWDIKVADQTIIRRLPNFMVIKGAQGIYRAIAIGETDLNAIGSPICDPGKMCPMFLMNFKLHIRVLP